MGDKLTDKIKELNKNFGDFLGEDDETKELCNYPKCRCPFDMGADSKCCKGLERADT